jgi:hypothetical protein
MSHIIEQILDTGRDTKAMDYSHGPHLSLRIRIWTKDKSLHDPHARTIWRYSNFDIFWCSQVVLMHYQCSGRADLDTLDIHLMHV